MLDSNVIMMMMVVVVTVVTKKKALTLHWASENKVRLTTPFHHVSCSRRLS